MRRHKDNNSTRVTSEFNEQKKLVYKTTIYPKIDRDVTDIYIEARQGDRLDNLAYQYYKDVTLWWVIAQSNNIGKGSMYVEPAQQIRIPSLDRVFTIVNELYEIEKQRL